MKFQFALILNTALFLFACSGQEKTVSTSADTTLADTTSLQDSVRHISIPASMDSSVFVGPADYFKETKQFYVPLYYRQESDNYVDPEQLDSVVFEKDGILRKRLPMKDAMKEFYLEELNHVSLFSENHSLLGKLSLSHVEYVENVESAHFVAVYLPIEIVVNEDELYYLISSNYSPVPEPGFAVEEIEDEELKNNIVERFNLDHSGSWVTHHLKVLPAGTIYSTVSNGAVSLLVETSDNYSSLLQEGGDDFFFGNITPLPLKVHGKPLILVDFYVPETDITGNFVSAFNGTTFEAVAYNRIPLDLLIQRQ